MIKRDLFETITRFSSKFPVIAIVGPRQAGKTTLARQFFDGYKYFSLEDPDTLEAVQADPRDFLERDYGTPGIIIDEFQHDPKLLSYMQGIVDRNKRPGYFVLTGSHNFLMNQAISQSLAGRVALLTLLPLSMHELHHSNYLDTDPDKAIFRGGYPNVFTRTIDPTDFYSLYTKTYVERDVRALTNVVSLSDFQRFMRLCAGRIGQLLNITSLADDCGISVPTVKAWLSILEASYVIFLLQPHFNNFSKRLIKSPKLYFYDTGLACWLLKITSHEQVYEHYLRGGLFESFILSDLYKQFFNVGKEPSIYFWRDSHGNEVDALLDYGTKNIPLEIKSSKTINQHFFDGLHHWFASADVHKAESYLIYAGTENHVRSSGKILGWQSAATLVIQNN